MNRNIRKVYARRKCLYLMFVLLLPVFADGRDIYVSLEGTNNYPFTNWPDAATNIEWAVNAAASGDRVVISNGTYVLTNTVSAGARSITISGFTNNGPVIIDGNNAVRCFYFNFSVGTYTAENLFITRGYAGDGGAIDFSYILSATVRDCVFSNNVATAYSGYNGGGAIYAAGDSMTLLLQRCEFVENNARDRGGAVHLSTLPMATIDNCRFVTNISGSSGGGLWNNGSAMLMTGSDFICNVATNSYGGGFAEYSGAVTGMNCAFVSNVALVSYGGGLAVRTGNSVLSNCYVSNNIAWESGGGVYIEGGKIKNCTLARNRRTSAGGSLSEGGGGVYITSGALVQDCIIEENYSSVYGGGVLNSGGTLRNCLLRNNIAVRGGGVQCYVGEKLISSCSIVSNYASSLGGGMENIVTVGTATVENCVIYYNRNGSGGIYSNVNFDVVNSTTYVTNSCFAPVWTESATFHATNSVYTDPLCVNPASGDYRLTRESPGINAGANRNWMADAFDLDGRSRLDRFSGVVDMGCYEYLPSGMIFGIR